MFWLLTFLGLAISCALVYYLEWRRNNSKTLALAASVPGPPALPILGNSLIFLFRPKDQLKKITRLMEKYGEYIRLWVGPDLMIWIKNPQDIRNLLTSNKINKKGPAYQYMETFLGPGIMTGGTTWRRHRKIINPFYNKKSVAKYQVVFSEEADEIATVLRNRDINETFNVYFDVVKYTTNCVCRTLLGLPKVELKEITNLYDNIKLSQRIYLQIYNRITKWWLQIPFIYNRTSYKRDERHFFKIFNDMAKIMVEKRRKAIKEFNIKADKVENVVDRFILGGDLDENEIIEETLTTFTTSQEASAKIAAAVLVFLAHLPEWQEKVYTEVMDVIGSGEITKDKLKQLHNLDMVFKEVLRYVPIGPMIQRTVEEEVEIDNGKYTLPVGTIVVFALFSLHRDPKYWDNPNKVDPGRFSPENEAKRDPNVFVPFSWGAMDCVGRVLAMPLIKTMVVKILQAVRLEADGILEELELEVAISTRFVNGYNLRVLPRKLNIN